jgi:serine protease
VIAVAGLRHSGTKVGFSDLGPEVAISAPGGNCVNSTGECVYPILTTTNAGTTTPVANSAAYSDGTNYSVGTSFSAPLVSGTVGLMFAAQPSLTPADVRRLLLASARSFPSTGGTAGIAQCHSPTSAVQDECYCTTATCGAGMLDAAAAVQASLRLSASITSAVAAPVVGQLVTLNAAASLPTGQTSVSYRWQLVDGGGIVTGLSGDVTSATVTATPTAAGSFVVSVTVTDTAGDTATSTRTIAVAAAASTGSTTAGGTDGSEPTPGATSSDSGGGSFDLEALLALGALAAIGRKVRGARGQKEASASRA